MRDDSLDCSETRQHDDHRMVPQVHQHIQTVQEQQRPTAVHL